MTYQPVKPPHHEYVEVRGLKHRLTRWGEPSDDPIVLLHGLQDCADTWQFLVDCLPDRWSLVAPDWRGFGGSDWAPINERDRNKQKISDILQRRQP